jgi:membrane associated rhomboid family serine protease
MGIGSIAIGADGASVAWQAHIGGFSPAWCCFRRP